MNELIVKTSGTNQKLWIIGDSFTGIRHATQSWPYLLYQSFVGKDIHVSSKGSRDVQNIIDIFLRNLKDIKNDDVVILFLPTMSRFRLPIMRPDLDIEWSSTRILMEDKKYHLEYFIGNSRLNSDENIKNDNPLEIPLNLINPAEFNINENDNDILNIGTILSIINTSNASITNMNEILNSFKKYFPFKLILCSWTDELDNTNVLNKETIKNNIGFWHTLRDLFNETDGKEGMMEDIHWSPKMDKAFSEYIIKKYTKYFNI